MLPSVALQCSIYIKEPLPYAVNDVIFSLGSGHLNVLLAVWCLQAITNCLLGWVYEISLAFARALYFSKLMVNIWFLTLLSLECKHYLRFLFDSLLCVFQLDKLNWGDMYIEKSHGDGFWKTSMSLCMIAVQSTDQSNICLFGNWDMLIFILTLLVLYERMDACLFLSSP